MANHASYWYCSTFRKDPSFVPRMFAVPVAAPLYLEAVWVPSELLDCFDPGLFSALTLWTGQDLIPFFRDIASASIGLARQLGYASSWSHVSLLLLKQGLWCSMWYAESSSYVIMKGTNLRTSPGCLFDVADGSCRIPYAMHAEGFLRGENIVQFA